MWTMIFRCKRLPSRLDVLGARRCGEVIEDTEQIPVQICCRELVQAPGLRLRWGHQFRVAGAPRAIQLIHFLFAAQIQPDQDWWGVAILAPKLLVGQKQRQLSFEMPASPSSLSSQST